MSSRLITRPEKPHYQRSRVQLLSLSLWGLWNARNLCWGRRKICCFQEFVNFENESKSLAERFLALSALLDQEGGSHALPRLQRHALSLSVAFCKSDTHFLSNEEETVGRRSLERRAACNLVQEFPFKCYLNHTKSETWRSVHTKVCLVEWSKLESWVQTVGSCLAREVTYSMRHVRRSTIWTEQGIERNGTPTASLSEVSPSLLPLPFKRVWRGGSGVPLATWLISSASKWHGSSAHARPRPHEPKKSFRSQENIIGAKKIILEPRKR